VAGTIHITNAEKVWWPDESITKADVARYYARVSERLLPWTVDRPLSVRARGTRHGPRATIGALSVDLT